MTCAQRGHNVERARQLDEQRSRDVIQAETRHCPQCKSLVSKRDMVPNGLGLSNHIPDLERRRLRHDDVLYLRLQIVSSI
jgi:hypothetical protein